MFSWGSFSIFFCGMRGGRVRRYPSPGALRPDRGGERCGQGRDSGHYMRLGSAPDP